MSADPRPPPDLSALSPLADEVAETLARVASDIALVIDSDGVIRRVAEVGSALPADFSNWTGRRWIDTVSADSRRKIEMLLSELRVSGVTQRREVNHPSGDGDDMPMAWTAIRLGARGAVVAVGRDLRAVAAIQRRFLDAQHEMELGYWQRRHADHRYRLLFQVAHDAVLVLDAHSFEVLDANPAACETLGPGRDVTLNGRALTTLLPDGARAAATELLATARAFGRAGEIPLRLAAGVPAFSFSATPLRVGARQQLLVRLRAGEDADAAEGLPVKAQTLVESGADAVVVTDSAGSIEMANPAFLLLVRQNTEAQIKGRPLADVAGDARGRWRELIARTRLHGLCTGMALQVEHGGITIDLEASAALLTDGDQEHVGVSLRALEIVRPATARVLDAWPGLAGLRAQVGLVPLDHLMLEASDAVERQLILTALRLGGTQPEVAARLLSIDAVELDRRMHRLGLALPDGDDPQVPPLLN